MSKFLQEAAMVVGGVALAATGVGALAGAGLFGAAAQAAAAAGIGTFGTIATVAKVGTFAAAALAAGSALTAKWISSATPDRWSANPDAGMDIVFGSIMPGTVQFRGAAP